MPAPDKSAAGFDSSDEDDDKAARSGVGDTASVAADDLDEIQSVTSTGTAGTALSAVTGLSATTAPTGAANQPDAWEALDESGDSDVDMTPSSKQRTSSDSNVLLMTSDGGGVNDPLSLDTPLPQSEPFCLAMIHMYCAAFSEILLLTIFVHRFICKHPSCVLYLQVLMHLIRHYQM